MVLFQFRAESVGVGEDPDGTRHQLPLAQLFAGANSERRHGFRDGFVVFDPLAKGTAHHDLLAIRLNFLQFHARVPLEFPLGTRQGDTECAQDVVGGCIA